MGLTNVPKSIKILPSKHKEYTMNKMDYIENIISRYGTALLNKKQASNELQISTNQLDRLRQSGELKYSKVGTKIIISASTLADFMVE